MQSSSMGRTPSGRMLVSVCWMTAARSEPDALRKMAVGQGFETTRVTMKKITFGNSKSIALQIGLGKNLSPEQSEPMKIEGWLIDEHVCVQKPSRDSGWRVSLYPWGDMISRDFFSKDDAVDCAKQVRALGIDWTTICMPENYYQSDVYLSIGALWSFALRLRACPVTTNAQQYGKRRAGHFQK
jgi:hypothetical protein